MVMALNVIIIIMLKTPFQLCLHYERLQMGDIIDILKYHGFLISRFVLIHARPNINILQSFTPGIKVQVAQFYL